MVPRLRFTPPALALNPKLSPWLDPFLLVGLGFAVFQQGLEHRFTNWDDPQYILDNPLIRGLGADRAWTAFTSFHLSNYNPLHIISYMVDYELWRLSPGGIFFGNLALHLSTGVIIYFFAFEWLRARGSAFLVAAVFLVHPTRIESVAWLSERKDVLSGFFAAAALLAYSRCLESGVRPGRAWAAASWLLFLLALLSKSQLVALPVVFLLLDLSRRRALVPALISKLPFFVLSAIFSWVTMLAQAEGGGARGVAFPESLVVPLTVVPRYLAHVFWPVGLSPYYDFDPRATHSAVLIAAGAAVILFLGACAWRSFERDRVWFMGILWFFALLAPVIGVLRINLELADRYLYLAIVGPCLAAGATLEPMRPRLMVASFAVVLAFGALSAQYVNVFHDSEALWSRVLARDPRSSMAHSKLGEHFLGLGRLEEAQEHFDADLVERPYFENSFLGRASIHEKANDQAAAAKLYEMVLEKCPTSVRTRLQYAEFLERNSDPSQALKVLLSLDRRHANAAYYWKLSRLFGRLGQVEDAFSAAGEAGRLGLQRQ